MVPVIFTPTPLGLAMQCSCVITPPHSQRTQSALGCPSVHVKHFKLDGGPHRQHLLRLHSLNVPYYYYL